VTRTVAAAVRGAGGGTPAVSPRSQPRWRQGPRGNTLSALRRAGLPNSAPAGRSPDLDRSSIEAVLLSTVRLPVDGQYRLCAKRAGARWAPATSRSRLRSSPRCRHRHFGWRRRSAPPFRRALN